MSSSNLFQESQSVTSETNVKTLILLATGRDRDLVEWELRNQSSYISVPLISFSSFLDRCDGDSSSVSGDRKKDITESTSNASSIRQKRTSNEVFFKAKFDCWGHPEHILQAVIANCILVRCAYDEELVSYALGAEQLWKNLFEMNVASSVTNVTFIGRRLKPDQYIEKALSNLSQKSRKRKLVDNDDVTASATELRNENEINSMEETKELELELNNVNHSTVLHKDNTVSKYSSKDIHLFSDSRGLTQAEEKLSTYYAAVFYCFGGHSSSKNFEKKYASKNLNGFAQTSGVTAVVATSSNSTTVMDFVSTSKCSLSYLRSLMISIRCYLTITSACVTPGHLIIDPFAGSGAILKLGSCFGAITMSSDVDSICCTHSALNKSTKGNCVLSDMKNSPWVGTYDAIVTDPPYNIRTHLLKEYNAETSDLLIPHVVGFTIKIHDLVEKLIENSTNVTGTRMFQIISICRDDYGMGKTEEKENSSNEKKGNNSNYDKRRGKNKIVKKSVEKSDIETLIQKNKEIEKGTDAIFPHNDDITQKQYINLVANITDCDSKHLEVNNKEESTGPRWTRCLITIEKSNITSNNHKNNTLDFNTESKNEDKKKLICLPNIFGDKKNAKSLIYSKKFDDFIYPGFRKELLKATWRGDVSSLNELEARVERTLNPDSRNKPVQISSCSHSSTSPLPLPLLLPLTSVPPSSSSSVLPSSLSSTSPTLASLPSPTLASLPTPTPTPTPTSTFTPSSSSPAVQPSSSVKSIWDCEDDNGSRPLMFAAGYGHVEVLRWLIQRGCDINYSPKGGSGPAVLRAARFGHAACVSLLLSQDCDLSLTDSNGYTAAAHALAFDHISVVQILPISAFYTENLNPKICQPVSGSNVSVSNQVKKMNDTEIDAEMVYWNANDNVMIAVNSSVESMECDTNNVTSEESNVEVEVEVPRVILRSALHILCQWGSIKCLDYLLALIPTEIENTSISNLEVLESTGSADDFNIENENDNVTTVNFFPANFALSDGTTALHVAARYGHLNCLKKLIEVGGDFRIMDINGNTPLLLSRKWGRTECGIYLSGLQDD